MHSRFSPTNSRFSIEAHIDTNKLQGNHEGYQPCLVINTSFKITAEYNWKINKAKIAYLGHVSGSLFMGNGFINHAIPTSANRLYRYEYPDDFHISFHFQINQQQIEWIEKRRAGDDLSLTLDFHIATQIHSEDGIFDAMDTNQRIEFTVPGRKWQEEHLPQLGFGKIISIEMPTISIEAIKENQHAYKALKKANDLFINGDYDQAASLCRISLDQFFEQVEITDNKGNTKKIPRLKKSWEKKLGQATYDWLNTTLGSLKEATNKSHHSPNSHFDRVGAHLVLMITTAVVTYAGSEPKSDANSHDE
jgi:hypothetical protein